MQRPWLDGWHRMGVPRFEEMGKIPKRAAVFVEIDPEILPHARLCQAQRWGCCYCPRWPREDATSSQRQCGTRTYPTCWHGLAFTSPPTSPKMLETNWVSFCGRQQRATSIRSPTVPLSHAGFGDCVRPPRTRWERKPMPWLCHRELLTSHLCGAEGKIGVFVCGEHILCGSKSGVVPGKAERLLGSCGSSPRPAA